MKMKGMKAPSSTFSNRGWFTKPQMGQQKEQQKEQQMGQQEMGRHPSWRQQRREQRLKEQQEEQERDAADWERFGTAVSASDENAVIRFLLSEKVFGYPHTSGGVLSNYLRYCFNNHPALSVLLMHPLHPFRRRYRVVVLLCSLSFAVCMSFLLLKTSLLPVIATCHNPCDCVEEQAQQTDDAETVCVGGFNDGRSCAFYHQRCALYAPWQLSAIAGAFTVLYDALIRAAATCGCVQGRSQFQSYMGGCLKWLVEYFGGISLLLFSLLSLAMALVTLAYCWQYHVVWTTLLTMVVAELWAQYNMHKLTSS
ncbi:hypothetical protein B484DRAFT_397304 [Ochromonadaceae sp. CCMP2298]|nr:hypothetical protein B484DRAFT_397304 [Ochromonadaceae sp. CCMP2298]